MARNRTEDNHVRGTLYALAAFVAWGVLPAYWKLLKQIPVEEILAHRIFWSFVFVSALLLTKSRWNRIIQALRSKSTRFRVIMSAVLITLNWFLYIWAVNSNHIVEASLGYYITPLLNVFLGLIVLHERINFWQYVAFALAAIGVLIMTLGYGKFPWISLTLALSFGTYGLLKKTVPVDSLTGLGIETLLATPFCLGLIIFKIIQGTSAFHVAGMAVSVLLVLGGVVTALPLLWFAKAAKLIPLSRVGFIQYLAPTISLLLGIFVYHETFSTIHALSFGCIWVALSLYTLSQTEFMRNLTPNAVSSRQ